MAAGKRLGAVKNATCRVIDVSHTVLAQRTRRRVVSGGGETGRQAVALNRGAARRYRRDSMVAVEH
jgi:hypothetical protein